MYYRYDCYQNGLKILYNQIEYANSLEEAIKQAYIKYNGKYEIVNMQPIL